MRLSRDHTHDARRWLGRFIWFLSGVAVLFVSMVIGLFFLVVGVLNEGVNLLLTFAAKVVKPRKLENEPTRGSSAALAEMRNESR